MLIDLEPVQRELKLTDAQTKEQRAAIERYQSEFRKKMQEARRDIKDRDKLLAATAPIGAEFREVLRKTFQPEQWERLDQIQLQAQGPLAFSLRNQGPRAAMSNVGPPLAERLKLSDDQVRRIETIVDEGVGEITKAASVAISLDPKDKPTTEDIRKFVGGPEFRAAREKATRAARAAWAAVILRIEEVLTASQREEYHRLLGVRSTYSV